MSAAWVFLAMGLIVAVLVGLAAWLVLDIHRINRTPEDDYRAPRSKGEWE